MTNERLQRLAIQLISLFPGDLTPKEIYEKWVGVAQKQREYFTYFEGKDVIKLIFFIYSYKTTGKFDLAIQILDRIFFALLYEDSGQTYTEECDYCGGDGSFICDTCDGDSKVDCNECDGKGTVECYECDGTGKYEDETGDKEECSFCDGEGSVDCSECEGNGKVWCPDCDTGRVDCNECDGQGEIDGDGNELALYLICSWDNNLKQRCELNVSKPEPVSSSNGFHDNPNKIILNNNSWGDLNFDSSDIDENEIYCWGYNDEMILNLDSTMHLTNPTFLSPRERNFTI